MDPRSPIALALTAACELASANWELKFELKFENERPSDFGAEAVVVEGVIEDDKEMDELDAENEVDGAVEVMVDGVNVGLITTGTGCGCFDG